MLQLLKKVAIGVLGTAVVLSAVMVVICAYFVGAGIAFAMCLGAIDVILGTSYFSWQLVGCLAIIFATLRVLIGTSIEVR